MIRKRLWIGLALSAVLLIHLDATAQKQLTVEDIYENPALRGRSISGLQWMANSRKFTYYQRDPETGKHIIWIYDVRNRKRDVFIDSEKVHVLAGERREKRFTLGNYFWSPDQRHILLPSGNDLYLYDSKTGEVKRLTKDEARERDPQFSPDGKKLAYLKNGNLTVLDIASGSERQLTTDASETILIGRFDWVYEEEFGIRTGFFWSPDGKRIAFWKLDQSRVPEFPIVDYIPTHNKVETMRYPKAGDPNSIVQIGVVEVESGATTWMDLGDNDDIYIPRIKWTKSPQTLAILRLNRDQNHLEFLLADVTTGRTRVLFEERMSNGWIDITDDWRFLKDGRRFIWSSRRDGWKHLYMGDLQTGDLRPITRGEWDAVSIAGVDEKRKTIYYISTEVSPLERHLFGVKFDGKKRWRISRKPGWHRVSVAPNFQYYIDYSSDVMRPTMVTLRKINGARIDIIEANELPALKEYAIRPPEFLQVPAADGTPLNAFMIKPPDFDPNKKYPVLIYNYSGPGSQIVRNMWGGSRFLWHQLLAQRGYIIFGLDNRGTGARGNAFMMATYKNLGDLESQDQIAGAKWLAQQPYVDASRIGIWGWSYGGYMAALTFLKAGGLFKVGISVAPVTDWRNYDTIYTERYMLTPEKNPEGYKRSSCLRYVDQLQGRLLIVHGTADDNVHLSNTLQLAYALQNARKPFDLMLYPRKLHGIGGRDTRIHLFNMMTQYILEHL